MLLRSSKGIQIMIPKSLYDRFILLVEFKIECYGAEPVNPKGITNH